MIKRVLIKLFGVLVLFGFLAGLLAIAFVPVEMAKMSEARGWPSRDGTITLSSIGKSRGGFRSAPHWRAELGGVYDENGEKFRVTRVRYGGFRFGAGKSAAVEDAAEYPVGARVKVYYSPTKPKDTLLEPLAPWNTMIITLAVGVTFVIRPFLLYACRKKLQWLDDPPGAE